MVKITGGAPIFCCTRKPVGPCMGFHTTQVSARIFTISFVVVEVHLFVFILEVFFLPQELTITGFNVYRYTHLFEEALNQLTEWCKSGDLKPYEHVVEGFENMPKAFMDQINGKSQGKVIVRV